MRAVLVAVIGIAVLSPLESRAATAQAPSTRKGASGAAAGQGAAAKPPPASAVDLSRALLSNEEWSKLLDRYSASLGSQLSQSLQAQKEPVPGDLQTNLRQKLGQKLPYDRAVQAQARALANHFTADELKQAATFYTSPTGKKVLTQLPQALSELGDELQGQLATTVPEVVAEVAPKALPGGHGDGGMGSGEPSPDGSAPPPQGGKTRAHDATPK